MSLGERFRSLLGEEDILHLLWLIRPNCFYGIPANPANQGHYLKFVVITLDFGENMFIGANPQMGFFLMQAQTAFSNPSILLLGPVVNIKPTAVEESLSVPCPEDVEQLETLDGRTIDGLFSSRPLRLFEPREWSTLLEEQRALELKGKGRVEEWKIVTGAVTWSGSFYLARRQDDVTLPESPSAVSIDKAWLVFLASSSPVLLVTGYT
ncbi:hypothetical protein K435DRAFT_844012 [Dendrothele bispora CBS 962.96]|uniref:Uncharacterized protein n=1 Tax=Dendrothele bispora (strain CBS 962.96) TaxID=1314807 RepID=A0A4S8L4J8_DENBC|nr:hypothetical protein K435DRAFT_844012 [Dendrothele bispora CBS 962.96]